MGNDLNGIFNWNEEEVKYALENKMENKNIREVNKTTV